MLGGRFYFDVGKVLQIIEERFGSQAGFAKHSTLPTSTLSRILDNGYASAAIFRLLCSALGLPEDDLRCDASPAAAVPRPSARRQPGPAGVAPLCPELVVGRQHDFDELRRRLVRQPASDGDHTVQVVTAVRGIAGVGKTTLISQLPYEDDPALKSLRPVLFASVGKLSHNQAATRMTDILRSWGRALQIPGVENALIPDVRGSLAAHLAGKRPLILLDDVWDGEIARQLFVGNLKSVTVITTRDGDVASALSPRSGSVYSLNCLSHEASMDLLRHFALEAVEECPQGCAELADFLGGLPLALRVTGGLLRAATDRSDSVADVIESIRKYQRLLEARLPAGHLAGLDDIGPTVQAVLQRSTEDLTDIQRECFARLGTFPEEPAVFTIDTAALFLDLSVESLRSVLTELVIRGLLEQRDDKTFCIHTLMAMHARSLPG